MSQRRKLTQWLVVLVVLHCIVVGAGFFAPYDPVEQDRECPYLPPMRVHLMDAQSHFHLRPFFYPLRLRTGSFDQYEKDTTTAVPLRFFTLGAAYRLLGLIPSRLHLFGSTGARFHLLGCDAFGRDQLSRILYGGLVSLLAGLLGAGVTPPRRRVDRHGRRLLRGLER